MTVCDIRPPLPAPAINFLAGFIKRPCPKVGYIRYQLYNVLLILLIPRHILQMTLHAPIVLIAIALFIAAAYGDIRTFRIPNVLCVAIALLGLLRLFVIGDLTAAWFTIGAGIAICVVTTLLFTRGLVGGGDVKLLTAASLLIGFHDLFPFFLLMSVCGAMLSLVVLIRRRLVRSQTESTAPPKASSLLVPYGVAISTAGVVVLLFQTSYTW